MSIASFYYDMPDTADVEARAKDQAEHISTQTLEGVEYVTCVFKDRSTITFGSNGYMGMEEK